MHCQGELRSVKVVKNTVYGNTLHFSFFINTTTNHLHGWRWIVNVTIRSAFISVKAILFWSIMQCRPLSRWILKSRGTNGKTNQISKKWFSSEKKSKSNVNTAKSLAFPFNLSPQYLLLFSISSFISVKMASLWKLKRSPICANRTAADPFWLGLNDWISIPKDKCLQHRKNAAPALRLAEQCLYPWVQFLWHSWHTFMSSAYFHTSMSSSPGTPWGHRATQNSPSWKLAHFVQFPEPWTYKKKGIVMFTTLLRRSRYYVNCTVS